MDCKIKECSACKQEKSLDEYYLYTAKSGRKFNRKECKECQKEAARIRSLGKDYSEQVKKNRKRRYENKIMAVRYKGGKCQICSGKFHISIYDFHHENENEKEFVIGNILGRDFKNIINELDECILLCANCHRWIHYYDPENIYGLNDIDKIKQHYLDTQEIRYS